MKLRTKDDWFAQTQSFSQLSGALAQEFRQLVTASGVGDERTGVHPIADGVVRKQSRILKQFNDLSGVTFDDTTLSSARVIDQSSPFGRPALKVTLTGAGSSGYVEIKLDAAANLPLFDDHVVWRVWLDDYTTVSELRAFIGNNSSYTLNNAYVDNVFNSNTALFSGPRVVVAGPMSPTQVAANPSFVFGTDTLVATKLRVLCPANTNTILWIDAVEIPARQRPVVCITFDDCDVSLATQAAPILEANGLRGTFAINTEDIGDGASFLTSANITALSDAGHQISAHNHNNYKLQTLYSSGILNGTSASLQQNDYVAEYLQAQGILEALGVPAEDFCYHPWVQGGHDEAAMQRFRALGVRLARGVVTQGGSGASAYGGGMVYGSGLGNLAMQLPWRGLGSGITLANSLLALADTVKYGLLWIPSGHVLAATSADATTWSIDNFTGLCEALGEYKAAGQLDVLTMRELADRFAALGILDGNPYGYVPDANARQIGHLALADFNSTADQAITLDLPGQSYSAVDIIVTNVPVSLTNADGGIYTGAGKTGTQIVASTQVYTALTGTTTQILRLTIASAGPVSTTLYFSLTGAQGSAATGDIFVFGKPA